jgi:hypothetical protein
MKINSRSLVLLSSAVAIALGSAALPGVVCAAPQMTMQSEEAAHPRIVEAIHHMKEALREMEAAPDDFGGNKAAAIHDCKVAIHSLRKALYFRLHLDDAALDRDQ